MRVIGYGEDAMTHEAVVDRSPELLLALGAGEVADDDLLIFYRPSFGRGGVSEFGEPDAVLCTADTAFHIEAKWPGSSEVTRRGVVLRDTQVRRHQILRWYVEEWVEAGATEWVEFASARRHADFTALFPTKNLPRADTKLATNLTSFLRLAARPTVVDVLLYLAWDDSHLPRSVTPDWFRLVSMSFNRINSGGLFDMGLRRAKPTDYTPHLIDSTK